MKILINITFSFLLFFFHRLPSLAVHTTKFKNIQRVLATNFPLMLGINIFPWNIELNDFTCFTITRKVQQTFLPSVNTKLTLDLTKRDKESGDVAAAGDEIHSLIHSFDEIRSFIWIQHRFD